MNDEYLVLLFYKYVQVDDPEKLKKIQFNLCKSLSIRGRIIVAGEGINGTIEGRRLNVEEYIKELTRDIRFSDIQFKRSVGTGNTFPKLSVKNRSEIVSAHLGNDINPNVTVGKYITPEQLYKWVHSKKKFYIVDMRNDYEQDIGHFNDSILAPFTNFRDLPKVLPILDSLKSEVIVTVCTGGVRCEKASGFLLQSGFKAVYQLQGGIISYMEKYPNEDFLGILYTFDGRVTMGFNTNDPKHVVVGRCKFCKGPAEKYFDCKNIYCKRKRHFISCERCIAKFHGFCSSQCVSSQNKCAKEHEVNSQFLQ